jgi:hypothetical protein
MNTTSTCATAEDALQQFIAFISQFVAASKEEQNKDFVEFEDSDEANLLLQDSMHLSGMSEPARFLVRAMPRLQLLQNWRAPCSPTP